MGAEAPGSHRAGALSPILGLPIFGGRALRSDTGGNEGSPEALVAVGASRAEASAPLREARAVAARIGANPLLRELKLLAQRARLDLAPPQAEAPDRRQDLETLGLTPREAEVLTLVARGYTNREIAATIAHRLTPHDEQ